MSVFDRVVDKEKKILENTYDSLMTVTRNVKNVENGRTKFVSSIVYSDEPCAITRNSYSQDNQSIPQNQILYTEILFCKPELIILQGDRIEVISNDEKIIYKAGTSDKFTSNQQIIVTREDRA